MGGGDGGRSVEVGARAEWEGIGRGQMGFRCVLGVVIDACMSAPAPEVGMSGGGRPPGAP